MDNPWIMMDNPWIRTLFASFHNPLETAGLQWRKHRNTALACCPLAIPFSPAGENFQLYLKVASIGFKTEEFSNFKTVGD